MNTPHTISDISFEAEFKETEEFHLLQRPMNWQTKHFECSNGLEPYQFASIHSSEFNTIHVQPSMISYLKNAAVAFKPSDDILRNILEYYTSNGTCAVSDRVHFDKVPCIRSSTYTLSARSRIKLPLYTRNPITGRVETHSYPYTTLPTFTTSAHPAFVAAHAYNFARLNCEIQDLVNKVGLASSRYVKSDFLKVPPSPPVTCPELIESPGSSSSSFPSTSTRSTRKRHREEEPPLPDISDWAGKVSVAVADEPPRDDLGVYSSEPSKTYDDAIGDGQAWIAVVKRRRTKRQRTKNSDDR